LHQLEGTGPWVINPLQGRREICKAKEVRMPDSRRGDDTCLFDFSKHRPFQVDNSGGTDVCD
jgi:hypothetical protein